MTKGNDNGARFGSVVEFQTAADAYFDACDAAGKLYGEAGLCLALGVSLTTLRRCTMGRPAPNFKRPSKGLISGFRTRSKPIPSTWRRAA